MKRKGTKAMLGALLSLSLLLPQAAYAADSASAVKDHWSFESTTSDQGDRSTGTLNGIALADSGDELFGSVLRFGSGTDKYMRLDDYLDTGQGAHSFSMWYRYDTSITGDGAVKAAVLLQHENKNGVQGKSILTLKASGQYHTYLNASDVLSNGSVAKGEWQHITVTFDQTSRKVSYYINGELDSTKDLGGGSVSGVLPLRIGAHKNSGSTDPHCMRGDVDELYVFNEALDADQARAVYAEKGAALEKRQLTSQVEQARSLLATLDPAAAEAAALNAAITQAESARTLEEVRTAKTALSEAIAAAQAAAPIVMTVGTDTIQTIDPSSIFGINHRYGYNGYGTFDSQTMQTSPEFKALYQKAGFGSIRYPGGSISNLFNWKTTLGSKEERKKQIHAYYNNTGQAGIAPNVGLCEISSFADEMDSELVYVYSFARGGAQDAADLVEYLNAAVGTNPNGGVDWASVRAANGHPEPFNVRHFEIGNEPQMGGTDGTTSQRYWVAYASDGNNVSSFVNGSDVSFSQIYCVDEQDWNKTASQTTGQPGLVRVLRHLEQNPMLYENGKLVDDPSFEAVKPGVRVYVGSDSSKTEWTVVDSLDAYGSDDKVCTVDRSNGKITFGDGVHGMIPAARQNVYATYTAHRDGFNAISKAMKDTQAAINEAESRDQEMNVYSGWEGTDFINLENQLGKADLYDGMTVHPYSGSVGSAQGEAFYLEALKKADDTGIGRVQSYVNMLPEGKVPVVSEYGIFRNTQPQVRSQTHALYIAKCLMAYAKLGSPYVQKHCLSDWYSSGADSLGPTQQAVIQVVPQTGASTVTGEGSFRYFATPSAKAFELINNGFGSDLREATLSSSPALSNGVAAISALASRDAAGNYSILVANLSLDTDYRFQLSLPQDAAGTKLSVQRLESESILDENSLENPDKVQVTTDAERDYTAGAAISVKKHSLAMIRVYTEADKTALHEQISRAEALKAEDYVSFTDLANRLLQARLASDNPYVSPEEVANKTARLKHAIDSLEEISEPTSIENAVLAGLEASYPYTGSPIVPQITVRLGDTTLIQDSDYTLSCANNIHTGSAIVTITGKGNYTGTVTGSFTITPASIAGAAVSGLNESYSWTGSAIAPALTLRLGEKALLENVDYTIAFENNVQPGTATVTITGTGDFAGSVKKTFVIAPLSIETATVRGLNTSYEYTGQAIAPEVTVRLGDRTLIRDTDYTIAYANNIEPGSATITITGKGTYAGVKRVSFVIHNPAVQIDTTLLEQTVATIEKADGSAYPGSLASLKNEAEAAKALIADPTSQQAVNQKTSDLHEKWLAIRRIPVKAALETLR